MKNKTKDILKSWLMIFGMVVAVDVIYFLVGGDLEDKFIWIPICLGVLLVYAGFSVTLDMILGNKLNPGKITNE